MTLTRLIYSSTPFGFDSATLSAILYTARKRNAADDITGALVCRADIYLQLLEGPDAQVRATLARIERDDRHVEVILRRTETVTERLFGAWAMLHDPAQSWMWDQQEVAAGVVDSATPDAFLDIFSGLAARQETQD